MANEKEVKKFVDSQASLQFYTKMRKALSDVLLAMPEEDFKKVTENLIIVCLHLGAEGQTMHFPPTKKSFKVVQLNYIKQQPLFVMQHLVAHELGHVMQGRNWMKSDGNKLELNADEWAKKWGFPFTVKVKNWSPKFWNDLRIDRHKF